MPRRSRSNVLDGGGGAPASDGSNEVPLQDPFGEFAQVADRFESDHEVWSDRIDMATSGEACCLRIGGGGDDFCESGVGAQSAAPADLLDLAGAGAGDEDFVGSDDSFDESSASPARVTDQGGSEHAVEFTIDPDMDALRGEFGEEGGSAGADVENGMLFQAFEEPILEVGGDGGDQRSDDIGGEAEPTADPGVESGADRACDEFSNIIGLGGQVGIGECGGKARGRPGTFKDERAQQVDHHEVGESRGVFGARSDGSGFGV